MLFSLLTKALHNTCHIHPFPVEKQTNKQTNKPKPKCIDQHQTSTKTQQMLVLLVTGQQGSRTQPYTDGRGCHAAVSNFLKEAHLHAHHPHQGLDLTCVGKCSLLMSPGSLEWQVAVVVFFFFTRNAFLEF